MGPNGYARLHDFIIKQMRMSHIYQPVMLRVLLENDGRASRRDIAKAILKKGLETLPRYQHHLIMNVGDDL